MLFAILRREKEVSVGFRGTTVGVQGKMPRGTLKDSTVIYGTRKSYTGYLMYRVEGKSSVIHERRERRR